MSRTADDYKAQLLALLPPGPLWESLAQEGNLFAEMLAALAEELARVDGRAEDLLDETDPRMTQELLAEWEAFAGLPDACVGDPRTVEERQAALHGKLTATGGASRQHFIDLARALGYEITIKEFFRFGVGSPIGQPLTNPDGWRHTWRVNGGKTTVRRFKIGSPIGEPLATWGNALLECLITHRKPAHTIVQFAYYLEEQHA